MESRSISNRTVLSLERLDERIAPSHGQADAPEPQGLALGHLKQETDDSESRSVTQFLAKLDREVQKEFESLIAKAIKNAEHSGGKGNGKGGDESDSGHASGGHSHDGGDTKGGAGDSDGGGTVTVSSGGTHGVVVPPTAPLTVPTVQPATPPKAAPAAAVPILPPTVETEDVPLPGSAAVRLYNQHLQFISTDALHGPTLSATPLDLTTVTTMGTLLRVAAESEPEEFQPTDPTAPPAADAPPDVVVPPEIQPADAVTRFVPFAPAAVDVAVRRFLDSLKASYGNGLSLTGKVIAWSAAIAGAIFIAEVARRKKFPRKAVEYLSLSKLLTRTRTK